MVSWWVGVAPAEVGVDCGGERHRVIWRDGALSAPDHADLDGERTLAALGGDGCACVEIVDAWERHVADEEVLVLGSRGPADQILSVEWGGNPYADFGVPASANDLQALMRLPGELPNRLVATVAAGAKPGPALHAALYGRVSAALGRDVELSIGEERAVRGDEVMLPFSWLTEVWARGLAVVMGRFIVEAATKDGRAFELTAADGSRVRLEL